MRSLLNSPDNAAIAASICEVAFALMVGPISGKTSIVLPDDDSSSTIVKSEDQKMNGIRKITFQKVIFLTYVCKTDNGERDGT